MGLIKSGILVQVYNYKKDKKLPLKGGIELSVSKGEPVTFFKVGPDIHLEYKDRFYLPDIQEEQEDRSAVFNEKTSSLKKTKEPNVSPAKEEGQCPICSISIPIMKLADHAADCDGLLSDSEEGVDGGLVPCPICNLEVEPGILEEHATTCAASMFGV